MITTQFGNLLTSLGGVPLAALAPLLWNAVLLVGVRQAIRARDRRLAEVGAAGTNACAEPDELRPAA